MSIIIVLYHLFFVCQETICVAGFYFSSTSVPREIAEPTIPSTEQIEDDPTTADNPTTYGISTHEEAQSTPETAGIPELFTIVNAEGGKITEEEQLGLLLYKGGTVCDDSFNYRAADAICNEMGFAYAKSWTNDESFSVQSGYDINLDDVVCPNVEWESCEYSEYNNCGHSEDVFLSCSIGQEDTETFALVDSEGNIITEEGQLGLLLYKGGTVCDDNFDDNAANAICRQMRFEEATRWTSEESFGIQYNYDIKLDDVSCGSEEWESCSFSEEHNCAHHEDVFLSCERSMQCTRSRESLGCWRDAEERAIAGGVRLFSSNVDDCMWYAVARGWTVFAVQYNEECFTAPDAHETYETYGRADNCASGRGGVWANSVYRVSCAEDATVATDAVDATEQNRRHGFRVVDSDGDDVAAGERGLLLYNGGTVCDDSFSENSANAICREMGFTGASNWVSGSEYSFGGSQLSLDITLDEVACSGGDWDSCSYLTIDDCGHSEDVFLTCQREISETVSNDGAIDYSSMTHCFQANMRTSGDVIQQTAFISEESCMELCVSNERCEACVTSPRTWADIECFLIGSYTLTTAGASGWETAERTCFDPNFQQDDTSSTDEDRGYGSGFNLIDSDGTEIGAGERGLLLYNGGTVCDDSFSENSANAICREMGYIGAFNWVSGGEYSLGRTQDSLDITLDDVSCGGDDWDSCSYSTVDNCGHSEDVFLTCLNGMNSSCVEENIDYQGADLEMLSSVRSIEHCLAVCEQRTDCVSVTHQPQTSRCWLKNKPFGDRYSLLDGVNSANIPCIEREEIEERATYTTVCYTDYQQNTGYFPDSAIIAQRTLIGLEECKEFCDEHEDCVAAVVSPSSWAHRECFLVSTEEVTDRSSWSAAIKNVPCVKFNASRDTDQDIDTSELFTIVNSEGMNITQGNQLGLLLYKGGTVCDDNFNDDAADAICKLMNFTSASRWNGADGVRFDIQNNYDIKLDDVDCSSGEWEDCSYSKYHNCRHTEDVFLSCSIGQQGNFAIVDSGGNTITEEGQLGLLLYKGGTVCDDSFDNNAANAICKQMRFEEATRWTSEESFGIQRDYSINLDEVRCNGREWESCTYNEDHDCGHSEDVFLSCRGQGRFRLNLALNQPTEQVDTHSSNGVASNAVDGNRDGSWYSGSVSHTEAVNGWWKVTLSEMTQISYIDIYNRMDCCEGRLRNARVSVDGMLVGLVPQVDGQQKYTISVDRPGQVVKILGVSGETLQLAEVEVYGPDVQLDSKWREDARCGRYFPLPDSSPSECNPNNLYCCSPFGWCGETDRHCTCAECVDYRERGDSTGPTVATDASGATDPTGATSTSPLPPDNVEFNTPQSNCFISNVRTFGNILQQTNLTSEGACLDLCVSIERCEAIVISPEHICFIMGPHRLTTSNADGWKIAERTCFDLDFRPELFWREQPKDVWFPIDWQRTNIQVKTTSEIGSGDEIHFETADSESIKFSRIVVRLSSTPIYYVHHCADDTPLGNLPDTTNDTRTWTFVKDGFKGLLILCDEVLVAHLRFQESSKSGCLTSKWLTTPVKHIKFNPDWDTTVALRGVDHEYTECSSLDPKWSNMGSDTSFPISSGDRAYLHCEEGYQLVGDESVVCFQVYLYRFSVEPACKPCELGTFKNNTGTVSCERCGEFEFSNVLGSALCKRCPPGSRANENRTGCGNITVTPKEVLVGTETTITCRYGEVETSSAVNISWLLKDAPLLEEENGAVRLQSTEYGETRRTLISGLTILNPTDDTSYKCVVMYQNEIVAERIVSLYVYGVTTHDKDAYIGTPTSLSCTVSGLSSPASVVWKTGSVELQREVGELSKDGVQVSTLTVPDPRNDSVYSCVVISGMFNASDPSTTNVSLGVYSIDTGDQEIIAGNNATISCTVTGISEEMSISWSGFTKEANFISDPGTYNSTTNSQTGTLKIGDNVTAEDATYTCTVASKLNTESENKPVEVKLNVYEVEVTDVTAYVDTPTNLTCTITGLSTKATVTWRNNLNEQLDFQGGDLGADGVQISTLTVPSPRKGGEVFTCVVTSGEYPTSPTFEAVAEINTFYPTLRKFNMETQKADLKLEVGLLFMTFRNENEEEINATVCVPDFDYDGADFFCSKLGYEFGQWGRFPQNFVFLPRWYLEEEEFPIAQCTLPDNSPSSSTGNPPCRTRNQGCRSDENIWLHCSNDEGDFERWRPDRKCGRKYLLRDGSPSECDPEGEHPCCNEQMGICGNTPQHCACSDFCIDYSFKLKEKQCDITPVGGFLKTVCSGYQSKQIFKCPHSETTYERHISTWDQSTRTYVLSNVTAVCEHDERAYQACGFNTPLTDSKLESDMFCGGFFTPKKWGVGSYTPLRLSSMTNSNCSRRNITASDCSEGLDLKCDGICDTKITCEDESYCNGHQYGLKCDRSNDEEFYVPVQWICNRESGCENLEDETNCLETDQSRESCVHFNYMVKFNKSIQVPLFNYTRCAMFDVSQGIFPYCLGLEDQRGCADPSRTAGYCKVNGMLTSISKSMVCFEQRTMDSPLEKSQYKGLCDGNLENSCVTPSADCLIHKHRLCDGVYDCIDKSDELADVCKFNTADALRCVRGFGIGDESEIPLSWINDGEEDCRDGRDESSGWPLCDYDRIESQVKLNEEDACRNMFLCPETKDAKRMFLKLDLLCDGVESCPLENEVCKISKDFAVVEKSLEFEENVADLCTPIKDKESKKGKFIRCEDRHVSGFPLTHQVYGIDHVIKVPESKVYCRDMYGEFYVYLSCLGLCENSTCPLSDSPLQHDSCPGQFSDRVYTQTRTESTNETRLTFVTEDLMSGYQNNYFECRNTRCIDYSKVCDLHNDCGDMSDEKDCSNHLVCESTVSHANPQLISLAAKCNGIFDCSDLSDECNNECGKEILEGVILKCLCWIMGIAATVFNAIVIFRSLWTLRMIKTGSKFLSKVLIGLIAVGDFLIGIYLLMLSVYDSIIYGKKFCKAQPEWLSGTSCIVMGIISTLGSQLSLFSMTALSLSRATGITFSSMAAPSSVNKVWVSKVAAIVTVVTIASTTVAVLPLAPSLEDFFVQGVFYDDPEYKLFTGFPNKQKHLKVIQAYYHGNSENITDSSWKFIREKVDDMFTQDYGTISKKMVHFYGNDGLCLFKYFVRSDHPARSLGGEDSVDDQGNMIVWIMLAVNFFCFVIIAISYGIIASHTVHSLAKSGQSKNREALEKSKRVQNRITFMIVTDFLCWIPFIVVSSLHNRKAIDATEWYVFFAMTILPINSVINPLIYDDSVTMIFSRSSTFLSRRSVTESVVPSVSVSGVSGRRTSECPRVSVTGAPKSPRISTAPASSGTSRWGPRISTVNASPRMPRNSSPNSRRRSAVPSPRLPGSSSPNSRRRTTAFAQVASAVSHTASRKDNNSLSVGAVPSVISTESNEYKSSIV